MPDAIGKIYALKCMFDYRDHFITKGKMNDRPWYFKSRNFRKGVIWSTDRFNEGLEAERLAAEKQFNENSRRRHYVSIEEVVLMAHDWMV